MNISGENRRLIDRYEREGYLILRGVIDAQLIEEAQQHVRWLMARNPDLRPEQLSHLLIREDPFWVRLVSDERLLDIAEIFAGPDIALFASHYICKPPGDGQPVLWHQDGSYWPLEPMEVISLWLAVDDATAENGCLRLIPGSHRQALQETVGRSDLPNVLGTSLAGTVDETKAVDCVMSAGDVEIHHPNIIHGSGANRSRAWRCGLTIRYIPATTRIKCDTSWPCAFLLRGEPKPGINIYHPFPRYREGRHLPFRGCEAWV